MVLKSLVVGRRVVQFESPIQLDPFLSRTKILTMASALVWYGRSYRFHMLIEQWARAGSALVFIFIISLSDEVVWTFENSVSIWTAPLFSNFFARSQVITSFSTCHIRIVLNNVLQRSDSNGQEVCCICFEQVCTIEVQDCGHQMCAACTLALCCHNKPNPSVRVSPPPACPFCRQDISQLVVAKPKTASCKSKSRWSRKISSIDLTEKGSFKISLNKETSGTSSFRKLVGKENGAGSFRKVVSRSTSKGSGRIADVDWLNRCQEWVTSMVRDESRTATTKVQ